MSHSTRKLKLPSPSEYPANLHDPEGGKKSPRRYLLLGACGPIRALHVVLTCTLTWLLKTGFVGTQSIHLLFYL